MSHTRSLKAGSLITSPPNEQGFHLQEGLTRPRLAPYLPMLRGLSPPQRRIQSLTEAQHLGDGEQFERGV